MKIKFPINRITTSDVKKAQLNNRTIAAINRLALIITTSLSIPGFATNSTVEAATSFRDSKLSLCQAFDLR
ncbi:hypothetical protein LACWKB8_1665 [Lactobacillus sp. wkB8]|nr:hypothetical protein LACWKB8_1665 [Lactobacillus sp. wkB8]